MTVRNIGKRNFLFIYSEKSLKTIDFENSKVIKHERVCNVKICSACIISFYFCNRISSRSSLNFIKKKYFHNIMAIIFIGTVLSVARKSVYVKTKKKKKYSDYLFVCLHI